MGRHFEFCKHADFQKFEKNHKIKMQGSSN